MVVVVCGYGCLRRRLVGAWLVASHQVVDCLIGAVAVVVVVVAVAVLAAVVVAVVAVVVARFGVLKSYPNQP